ncbi:RHS domain-containing protein [Dechloromonas denitrificans]|nr:RHS domain-containing protein [Dechloromonas denitrificans]
MKFGRTYNSNAATVGSVFGARWRSAYGQRLSFETSTGTVRAYRPDGKLYSFHLSGNVYLSDADINNRLRRETDPNGGLSGYRLDTADLHMERYDLAGRLISLADVSGKTQVMAYDLQSRLSSITDGFGRILTFTYDSQNRVATLTNALGGIIRYTYDAANNLSTVTYPDGNSKTYHYEDSRFPNALTGITDENGIRYITYTYDSTGRAIGEILAGNVEPYGLNFGANSTVVTDPLGTQRTYNFQTILGVAKNTGVSQPGGSGCGPASSAITYDANGNVATRTDFNGNTTTYTYDLTRNLETQRVEAAGKPEQRTITTQWHPYWRLPVKIVAPLKITTYVYNGDGGVYCAPSTATIPGINGGAQPIGVLCARTEQAGGDESGSLGLAATALPGSLPRTWAWTYNATGQVLSENGPRTDVADVATTTYYPANDPDLGKRGNIATVTNALGHVTQYTAYDLSGRPLTVVDPNGIVTTFTYTPRGWLQSRSVAGQTTTYDYDGVGQLIQISLPDDSRTDYIYDSAHRLEAITDSAGNRLAYQRDAQGNITRVDWLNSDGSTAKSQGYAYDALGRRQALVDPREGQDATTVYGYDANGRSTTIMDPKQQTTAIGRDALGRVTGTTDPLAGLAQFSYYGGQEQLKQVIAANGSGTVFETNYLGDIVAENSTNRGLRLTPRDAAGNIKSLTESRGVTATFTWDALNRLRSASYTPTGETIAYTWDSCPQGIGRQCGVIDPAGTSSYAFDAHGNRLSETRTIASLPFTTTYTYDAANRLASLVAPSGTTLTYARDAAGRIERLTANLAGNELPLLAVTLDALGQATSQVFADGRSETRRYGPDGRLAEIAGTTPRTLDYDLNGNLVGATSPAGPTAYAYDPLDRVVGEAGPAQTQTLTYDANGNRISDASGPHSYLAQSDRLTSIAGQTISANTAGYLTQAQGLGFIWDGPGALKEIRQGSPGGALIATYDYDALGRRLKKTTTAIAAQGAGTTLYLYDQDDRLLSETDGQGNPRRTYVWRDDIPVAVIEHGPSASVLLLETDHLGTPRAARNAAGSIVWQWESDAFGATPANEDPDGDGTATTINLRFPGQYYDRESGLHYNWHRYYDPRVGRYISADPIGLAGGLNTYSYVGGNPLSFVDPLGLAGALPSAPAGHPGYVPSGPGQGTVGAWNDFVQNYNDMRNANTIGGDKYFHCKANCEASKRGKEGEKMACLISDTREWVDQNVKGDPASASAADQIANHHGRSQGASSGQSCQEICSPFRPNGLPGRY